MLKKKSHTGAGMEVPLWFIMRRVCKGPEAHMKVELEPREGAWLGGRRDRALPSTAG